MGRENDSTCEWDSFDLKSPRKYNLEHYKVVLQGRL